MATQNNLTPKKEPKEMTDHLACTLPYSKAKAMLLGVVVLFSKGFIAYKQANRLLNDSQFLPFTLPCLDPKDLSYALTGSLGWVFRHGVRLYN